MLKSFNYFSIQGIIVLITALLLSYNIGIIFAIHAIMNVRTSQGAIAWSIFLCTFPYVAVPAYWFLGRSKFEGYTSARVSSDKKIQQELQNLSKTVLPYQVDRAELKSIDVASEKLVKIPYLNSNDVKLLVDGDATFESIIDGIEKAKSYVLFQFYIVHDDEIGRRIKETLIKKANEGVKIYFLYDEIGSHNLPDSYKNELRNAGIEVSAFHTRKGIKNRFQINFRNHRKIVVVDGKDAWIGGHNVGDEYLGKDPKFGHWRDTHIKITGPSALSVQIAFTEDWFWATSEYLKDICWTPTPSKTANIDVLIIPASPADKLDTAALMYLQAITSAQKRIWIASPYFVPDDSIIQALQLAGLRGVDVRILIPAMADHLDVYLAAFTYIKNASLTGVKFFRYKDGFLHQKVMLIDDTHATVGTANFDNRSFRLNFEIIGLIANREFNTQIQDMLLEDFKHSVEVKDDEMSSKPFYFRFAARLARLLAPIL